MNNKIAFVIGNNGLGDSITIVGMVNYLASEYKYVFVACVLDFKKQVEMFYSRRNIIIYPIDGLFKTHMYEFAELMSPFMNIYDIYYFGNYGFKLNLSTYTKTLRDGTIKKIISHYPLSYYQDVNMTEDIMNSYFSITYPQYILDMYKDFFDNHKTYRVVHQDSSNVSIDLIGRLNINIEDVLTIDVNKNLYPPNHKYYDICQKFINLPSVIFYAKLLENATELYLIDSCIHALALMTDISHAEKRVCLKRESRFDYGISNKFDYCQLIFQLE